MRLALLTAALAAPMFAQNGLDPSKTPMLVQGVVLDKDTRQPVEGARVNLILFQDAGPANPSVGGLVSGAAGDFQARGNPADRLTVSAQAEHYQPGSTSVRVMPGQEAIYVEVLLLHLQNLEGVLVDDETRKPIEGLTVEILARPAAPGGISMDGVLLTDAGLMGKKARTVSGADGRFLFPELPHGEFFLRISDKPAVAIEQIPAKDLEGDGRDKALEPPEGASSYGTIIWPGQNADVPSTPGITIGPSMVDVGEIRLVRAKLTNLTGIAGPCEEGASLQVMLSRIAENAALGMLASQDLPCGSGFRLLNLPDGALNLTALQGFPQRRWVSQTIDARSRSPLRVTLNAFVAVEISVELENGKLEDLPEGLRVTLSSSNPSIKVDQPARLRPGAFEATLYPGEQYRFSVQAGPQYYLKQAAYNASPVPDRSSFTASTAGVSQLNLVVSNHAASIEVHLTHNGNPVQTRQTIFLLKDGMSFDEFRQGFTRIPIMSGNAMVFNGLAPGTYRAIGPDADNALPTLEPLFEAMLKDGSRLSMPVTVDEGQTATINWDIP